MRVGDALRVRHGVVHPEHTAVWGRAYGRVHAHISKGGVDALELPDELGVFVVFVVVVVVVVVDDEAWTKGGVPAEIGLGRGRLGIVEAEVVLERGLSSPEMCGDGAAETKAKGFAGGSREVGGWRGDSLAIVRVKGGTARPQLDVLGGSTGQFTVRIEGFVHGRLPYVGSACFRVLVLSNVRGGNEGCVTCEPVAGCSVWLRDDV